MLEPNVLYYGDNLDILRNHNNVGVDTESIGVAPVKPDTSLT
jgi:hypothetical protein